MADYDRDFSSMPLLGNDDYGSSSIYLGISEHITPHKIPRTYFETSSQSSPLKTITTDNYTLLVDRLELEKRKQSISSSLDNNESSFMAEVNDDCFSFELDDTIEVDNTDDEFEERPAKTSLVAYGLETPVSSRGNSFGSKKGEIVVDSATKTLSNTNLVHENFDFSTLRSSDIL